ncbi:lipid IV(A) 3-deoxy-D-manno-octulosonic acid transferase [Lacimicrobium sp. SS2-24]|uniref:lipid IV(A) 3-deoxy-D-manno-octulosonic acid transferase n=1 Tax=Lacimicrobium sp. SS2-24 TaxID=2005569 RepID=UPI001FEE5E04|nr:lipid IV(A) 3-deoxy-D-manno-octulosonic acid transferase [Lacimicrobium sp. SS2-24]
MMQKHSTTIPRAIYTLSLIAYTLLWVVLSPLLAGVMLRRGNHSRLQEIKRLPERFGFSPSQQEQSDYLFHCVSVGEVVAATPLIRQLQATDPNLRITVTTTTATGSQRVQDTFEDSVNHAYLPFDMPWTMSNMLKRIKPKQVVIVEVELWPNMIRSCWCRNIPVTVVNGRMTDRSASRYQKLRALFTPTLTRITRVCAQGQRDYDNYLALGVVEGKLVLTNNMKFDLQPQSDKLLGKTLRERYGVNGRPVIIGGSTHAPEETLLLKTYGQLKADFPDLLLVLVPRHPQRFDAVYQLCLQQQKDVIRTSQGDRCQSTTDVMLADEMGMLSELYAISDIAFVGGSLCDRGGHNALEPAQLGIPIVMGPSQYNNPQICAELETSGALATAHDEDELLTLCRHWLSHPEEASDKGAAGQIIIARNAGAVKATLDVLQQQSRREGAVNKP